MKERGIICKADEVRQLLGAERSTVSRVVRAEPDAHDAAMSPHWKRLPLGNVGDHLWVRETCNLPTFDNDPTEVIFAADHSNPKAKLADIQEGADGRAYWTRSVHMPRWASRITLEVVQSIVQPIDGEWVQTVTIKRIDKAGVK